jgi:signal transduction histidine kinase
LLAALATQTVTALENARLVADLRSLNMEISGLNEDLRLSNERLERLDAVKSDFISIASHELRTPLTQIQGYADLLMEMSERNLLTPQQTVEITASLRHASQRMGEVIASMLDVSQIDVENMDLSFVETSLASIIKLAIEPFSEAIHKRNLTLVARGLRSLPPIYGDYKRLVQAFEALITNAIKFTPDGGKINVAGEVYEQDAEGRPKSVRVIIQDTGIGIDPQHHRLIFEKFYRVGSTALHSTGTTKYKGAGPGLGLPIAKGIIEGHGGRIWVESEGHDEERNPGSAFHVVLPVHPTTMDARQRILQLREAAEETEGAAPAGGKS